MAPKYSDEFKRDVVRITATSRRTRPHIASDIGVGVSALNKWVQQHQNDDLISGPHEDVEKEKARLSKENQILREEREVQKRRRSTDQQGYSQELSPGVVAYLTSGHDEPNGSPNRVSHTMQLCAPTAFGRRSLLRHFLRKYLMGNG